jgi:hypothetical protein
MRSAVGFSVAVSLAAAMLLPGTAKAGIYSDDLSRCLVTKTSDADKILLAKWIFSVMSVHPSAAAIATISDADRTDVSEATAGVFEMLLTDSCRDESAKAVKYEGTVAIGNSFKVLGEIAMTTLLADPKVEAESQNFIKYVDEAKMKSVFAE